MSHNLHTELPPQLADILPNSEGPYYLGRTSPWLWKSMMAGLLAFVLGILVFATAQAWQGRAGWMAGAIAVFCLPFLLLLLRPATWQSPISMVADRNGLHFLHGNNHRECSFVPWQHTGPMQIESHCSRQRILLSIRDDSPFWDHARQSKYAMLLLPPVDGSGYRKLRLSQVVGNLRRAMATLEFLRGDPSSMPVSRRAPRARTPEFV